VHQEDQQLGFIFGEPQVFGCLLRDPLAHFGVVFGVSFSDIVQQESQMEERLVFDSSINLGQGPSLLQEFRAKFHRADAVGIDGVLMEFVELQQASGMLKRRNDLFEDSQFVESPQLLTQPSWVAQQFQELLGGSLAKFRDRFFDRFDWLEPSAQ
jgi:hypothetical protein